MKGINLLSLISILLLCISCSAPCEQIKCFNDGICIDGKCECPDNFIGENCETFDDSRVQFLLDDGFTPKELIDMGVNSIQSFHGKNYEGGIIMFVDPLLGSGLIISPEDLTTKAPYGCPLIVIPDINQTGPVGTGAIQTQLIIDNCFEPDIAARLCADLVLNEKDDWFLPSCWEFKLILTATDIDLDGTPDIGDFKPERYWTSSQDLSGDGNFLELTEIFAICESAQKSEKYYVRPIRKFDP